MLVARRYERAGVIVTFSKPFSAWGEIAERLVISPRTAGSHIEHIYAKIDASSRATANES